MQPEFEDLIPIADTIAYVEVLTVDKTVKQPRRQVPPRLGEVTRYPAQKAEIRFIRILKGLSSLKGKTTTILKPENYYCFQPKIKIVVYLKGKTDGFITLGKYLGEHRLASAIKDIKNRIGSKEHGLIISLTEDSVKDRNYKIIILAGRTRYPLHPQELEKYRAKRTYFDNNWISEVVLKPGIYTVLVRYKDVLYHPYQIGEGYYCSFVLDNNVHWEVVYFDISS